MNALMLFFLSLQANHPHSVYTLFGCNVGVCLYPQPGSPMGGVSHSWTFRVSNQLGLSRLVTVTPTNLHNISMQVGKIKQIFAYYCQLRKYEVEKQCQLFLHED